MKSKEINKLSNDELVNKLDKLKKDLFNMRFKKTNGPIEDSSLISRTRKDVAKILTKLNKKGKLNIKNSDFKNDLLPLESDCNCNTCNNYTRSYIHHLFKAGEVLGMQLVSVHNIYFMNKMMSQIRKAIDENNFEETKKKWFSN